MSTVRASTIFSYLATCLLLTLLLQVFQTQVHAQTNEQLEDFNAAYLQYGNTLESNPEVATQAARRAYDLGREIFGSENERTAMLAVNYALLLETEQTQLLIDEAVTIYQASFGFGSAQMIRPLTNLGQSLASSKKWTLAEIYFQRAMTLAQRHLGEDSPKVGILLLEIGAIDFIRGRTSDLMEKFSLAQSILQKYDDIASRDNLARSHMLMGRLQLQQDQTETALENLLASMRILSAYPNSSFALSNRVLLIEAYEKLGLRDQATEHCLAIGALTRLRPEEDLTPLYRVVPDAADIAGTRSERYGVRVSFTVDAQGFVRDPMLMSTVSGETLPDLFLNSIEQFRFAPRFVAGQAVASPNQQYMFRF